MEGGSSTSFLARYLMENTEADVFVLNPCKLHIIFESACKTDGQDCIRIAKYIRDTNPSNWCLIPVPTYEDINEEPDQQPHKHKTGEAKGDQPDACIVQPERNLVSEEERPQRIRQKA